MNRFLEKKQRGTEGFPFAHYKQKYSNDRIDLHWHPEIEILYGISGELAVTVEEEKQILRAGDILFINPEELHSYSTDSAEVQYHAAVFQASLFQFQGQHFFEQEFTIPIVNRTLKFPRMIRKQDVLYEQIGPIVVRMFEEHIDSDKMIFADLTMLFCILMETGAMVQEENEAACKKSEDIKYCILYMEENAAEKITLAQLADLIHMNPNYFCSYFKKHTGVTPFIQLNSIRIKRAAQLLRQSEKSVAEIAELCGFESANYFIRKFKEAKGCTPAAYRKK